MRLVVPFTPGGQADIMARLLGARLSAIWGGTVVVENRPGGNGITGAGAALRAAPDGDTLLLITSTHAINEGRAAQPARLAAAGGGRAGGLALAGPGRGGAPAVTDLAAGTRDIMFANLPDALPAIQAGRLRALAVTAERRQRLLPRVPTMAKAGFGGLQIGSWTALVAAAPVPAAPRGHIAADAAAAVADTPTASRAAEAGFDVLGWGERETAAFVAAEVACRGALVREAEIRPEA